MADSLDLSSMYEGHDQHAQRHHDTTSSSALHSELSTSESPHAGEEDVTLDEVRSIDDDTSTAGDDVSLSEGMCSSAPKVVSDGETPNHLELGHTPYHNIDMELANTLNSSIGNIRSSWSTRALGIPTNASPEQYAQGDSPNAQRAREALLLTNRELEHMLRTERKRAGDARLQSTSASSTSTGVLSTRRHAKRAHAQPRRTVQQGEGVNAKAPPNTERAVIASAPAAPVSQPAHTLFTALRHAQKKYGMPGATFTESDIIVWHNALAQSSHLLSRTETHRQIADEAQHMCAVTDRLQHANVSLCHHHAPLYHTLVEKPDVEPQVPKRVR